MGFVRCVCYLALIGALATFAALLPRRWFDAARFPYRSFAWEREGEIYRHIGITAWKDHVPDLSRILPWMARKRLDGAVNAAHAELLARETCVSECVHWTLSLLSLYCLRLWPGAAGAAFTFAFILVGHLPFICIQRYNRPRLVRLAERLRRREEKRG